MKYAFVNDIAVHIMRLDKYGNAVKGFANITEFSDDNPHDDVATVTMTLSGIGKPEFVLMSLIRATQQMRSLTLPLHLKVQGQ